MEARDIYHKMRAIAEPIHAYTDQMVAIAKWIEAEFDYNPQNKALKDGVSNGDASVCPYRIGNTCNFKGAYCLNTVCELKKQTDFDVQ